MMQNLQKSGCTEGILSAIGDLVGLPDIRLDDGESNLTNGNNVTIIGIGTFIWMVK